MCDCYINLCILKCGMYTNADIPTVCGSFPYLGIRTPCIQIGGIPDINGAPETEEMER